MSDSDDKGPFRLMLAYLCVANEAEANLGRKVQILDRLGIQDSDTAQVWEVAVQSVRDAHAQAKKGPSGAKKK